MKIKIENQKIKIKLNFFEKLLSFKFKDLEFEFSSMKKVKNPYSSHPVKFLGIIIPFLIKYGTFYRIKNKKNFFIGLFNIVVLFPTLIFVYLKYNYVPSFLASILLLVFNLKAIVLSLNDKALYFIRGKNFSYVFYLKDNEDGYKKLFISQEFIKMRSKNTL